MNPTSCDGCGYSRADCDALGTGRKCCPDCRHRALCGFCERPLPLDRQRYRVRQCCQRGHDFDTREIARGQRGFTREEFLARVAVLENECDELMQEVSAHVEPSTNAAYTVGALNVTKLSLNLIRNAAAAGEWVPIIPCEECAGTVQHKLGCSRD